MLLVVFISLGLIALSIFTLPFETLEDRANVAYRMVIGILLLLTAGFVFGLGF
jgi:hypothetical protein